MFLNLPKQGKKTKHIHEVVARTYKRNNKCNIRL
jgi:hypothetical protein